MYPRVRGLCYRYPAKYVEARNKSTTGARGSHTIILSTEGVGNPELPRPDNAIVMKM